jgi:hypothetical protein
MLLKTKYFSKIQNTPYLYCMPHYRIQLQLEKEPLKEYILDDGCKDIDLVYNNYRHRVIAKNGAGRVIYFDMVMIAEESLKHLDDRKEIFNEENNFRNGYHFPNSNNSNNRKSYKIKPTLGERRNKNP